MFKDNYLIIKFLKIIDFVRKIYIIVLSFIYCVILYKHESNEEEWIMKKRKETTDSLTKIGNSLYLYQNYHEYMEQYKNVQLIMIDVEKFKQINDTFGHNTGDLYLKTVAQLLTRNFPYSLVARIHGDEFIVLTNYNEKEIEEKFSAIEKEIQELVKKEEIPTIFRINAGSTLFDANNIELTKEKADLMMYMAKSNGVFYQSFSEVDWKVNEIEKNFLK